MAHLYGLHTVYIYNMEHIGFILHHSEAWSRHFSHMNVTILTTAVLHLNGKYHLSYNDQVYKKVRKLVLWGVKHIHRSLGLSID